MDLFHEKYEIAFNTNIYNRKNNLSKKIDWIYEIYL